MIQTTIAEHKPVKKILPRDAAGRQAVLEAIARAGRRGLTYPELERAVDTGVQPMTRLFELRQMGLVAPLPRRKTLLGLEAVPYALASLAGGAA
jgi:hypothetical protein